MKRITVRNNLGGGGGGGGGGVNNNNIYLQNTLGSLQRERGKGRDTN